MAISQHQFYLDRKHSKNVLSPSRNFSDIADELSHGSYSTETSSLGRSVSSLSLPALKLDSDSYDEALDTVEMFVALKARKEALEKTLRRKCEELKKICLREGELTGALPPEMPLSPGEQIPIIRKKVGTPVRDKMLWRKKTKDEEEMARLELEHEIQTKIVSAAFKLMNDSSLKKNIRRQRKLSHQKAVAKLKEIEQKLSLFKKREFLSDEEIYRSSTEEQKQPSANFKDLSITFLRTDNEREGAKNSVNKMTSSTSSPVPLPSIARTNSSSVPSSPSNLRHRGGSLSSEQQLQMKQPELQLQGYTPSSVYQTQTSYRSQQYPTFSMRSPTSCSSASSAEFGANLAGFGDREGALMALTAPYRNKFESTLDLDNSNLYSVPTQRTSQAFDTQDDILATIPIPPQDLGLVSRHNSLDRNRRHSFQKYRRWYLEHSGLLEDPQQHRPGSAQPPAHLTFQHCEMYQDHPPGMFPYQEQIEQSSMHLPHHYQLHHHQDVTSPTAQAGSSERLDDANMYQKNLKLYAADAMYLGSGRHHYRTSVTSPMDKQTWPGDTKRTPTPLGGAGLLSPTGTIDRKWHGSQQKPHGVHSSMSVDSLKSHATSGHQSPSVDVVTYGQFQPYWEETKPYETSDFYKYSTKHRKQHQAASQNLHAKLLAWKTSQASAQFHGGGGPPPMSPVLERSRTASPAGAVLAGAQQASVGEDDRGSSAKMKSEGSSTDSKEPSINVDAFHDEILDWFTKQEKGKKTTLV